MMPPLLTLIIPLLAAFLGTICYNHGSSILQFLSFNDHLPFPPHYASWNTWFHPSQYTSTSSEVGRKKGWNIHHYLGGIGPWVEMVDEEESELGGIHVPEGCFVNQVHMVSVAVWFL